MKTVGIIGGLGPETTAEFYLEVIFQCQRRESSNRPGMLIWSVPVPHEYEEAALLRGVGVEKFCPLLITAAQHLEQGGADFLVMPCNTLHRFINELRDSVRIPVLSILETCAKHLTSEGVTELGLIATGITLEAGFYQAHFKACGINLHTPNPFHRAKLGRMIHSLVTNRYAARERAELQEIIDDFAGQGIRTILLACTDLQALVPQSPKVQILDSMRILADAVVDEICG
jgi:aspartate racemase